MKSNVTNTQKHAGKKNGIVIGAILSYSNPLHHPTRDNIMMRASTGYPVNYSSESELASDPFSKPTFFSTAIDLADRDPNDRQDEEETAPSKEDENIDVPNNTDSENAVPESEDPDKAKDDIATE